jgi:hypothetical protein
MLGSNPCFDSRRVDSRREEFLEILPKESVGIELGVFKGEFSEHILQIVQPRELHLVDVWWTEYGEHYPDWGLYTDHGRLKTKDAYESVMRIVERHGAKTKVIVHVGDGLEYLRTLPDDYLDWSYIDTSHQYEQTWFELEVLKDKIKAGGLITGDDWIVNPTHRHHGVYRAVKDFCAAYKWEIVLLTNKAQWAIQQRR